MRLPGPFSSLAVLTYVAKSGEASSEIDSIPAFSRLGTSILSKARSLEEFEYDTSWIGDYSIQFVQCHSVLQYGGGEEGGGNNEEGAGKLYMQNLIKFRLCPVNSCDKNCKGQYLVGMREFMEAYMDYKQEALEEACEAVAENCYCNDDAVDDQACENQCFVDAGLDDCVENDDDEEEEFEIERFLECEEMEIQNNNYKNYYYENGVKIYRQFFLGLKCANKGKGVYLDVFTDGGCSTPAPSGTYEKYNYGSVLPYKRVSMIDSECIPCKEKGDEDEDDNNGNDGDEEEEVELIELCEESYEQAGKCEKDLNIAYPRNDECDYMSKILLKHDSHYKASSAPKAFAIIFAASTLGLGYMLYQTMDNSAAGTNRGTINLAGQDHHMSPGTQTKSMFNKQPIPPTETGDKIETMMVSDGIPA